METLYKVNYGPQSLKILNEVIKNFKNEDPFRGVRVIVSSKAKALYLRHNLLDYLGSLLVDNSSESNLKIGLINVEFTDFDRFCDDLFESKDKIASGLLVDAVIWNCLENDPGSYFYEFRNHLPTRNRLAVLLKKLDRSSAFYDFIKKVDESKELDRKTRSLISLYQGVIKILEDRNRLFSRFGFGIRNDNTYKNQVEAGKFVPTVFYLPELLIDHQIEQLLKILQSPSLNESVFSQNLKFIVGSSPLSEIQEHIYLKILGPLCNIFNNDPSNTNLKDCVSNDNSMDPAVIKNPDFKFIVTTDAAAEIAALNNEISADILEGESPYNLTILAQSSGYGKSLLKTINHSSIDCNGFIPADISQSYVGMVLSRFVSYIQNGYGGFELWDLLSVLQDSALQKLVDLKTKSIYTLKSDLRRAAANNPDYILAVDPKLCEFENSVKEIENLVDWNQVVSWLKLHRDLLFKENLDEQLFSTSQQLKALYDFNNLLEELKALEGELFEVSQEHIVQVLTSFLGSSWSLIPVIGNGIKYGNLDTSGGIMTNRLYVLGLLEGILPSGGSDELMLSNELLQYLGNDSRVNMLDQLLKLESSVRSAKAVRFFCPLNEIVSSKKSVVSRFFFLYLAEKAKAESPVDGFNGIVAKDLIKFKDQPYYVRYPSYFSVYLDSPNNLLNQADALLSYFIKISDNNLDLKDTDFFQHFKFKVDGSDLDGKNELLKRNNLELKELELTESLAIDNLSDYQLNLNFYKIKAYLKCPKLYYYSYVLGLDSINELDLQLPSSQKAKGTALHCSLNYFNIALKNAIQENTIQDQNLWSDDPDKIRRLINNSIEKYCDSFNLQIVNQNDYEKRLLDSQKQLLKVALLEELKQFRNYVHQGLTDLDSELSITYKTNISNINVCFKGKIDRLEKYDSSTAVFRDYKVTDRIKSIKTRYEKPLGRINEIAIQDYLNVPDILQTIFYGWMFKKCDQLELDKDSVADIQFSYEFPFSVDRNSYSGQLTDKVYENIDRLLNAVSEGILAHEFPAKVTKENCDYCSYKEICKDRTKGNWNSNYQISIIGRITSVSQD